MSEIDNDAEFRKIVDSFIHLANEHIDTIQRERVGMALLYAAARFNSFVVASHATELNIFESERATAFEFFVREYQRMLNENLDDHRKLYEGDRKYAHLMTNQ